MRQANLKKGLLYPLYLQKMFKSRMVGKTPEECEAMTSKPISWAEGATHRVYLTGNNRYYGKHYERGVGPIIVGVLMDLFASPDVTQVWYGSDYEDGVGTITREDVLELAANYMQVGTRPYRGM